MAVFGGDEVSALVLDIGTRVTKVGYAGQDTPQGVFSSYVGTMEDAMDTMDGMDTSNKRTSILGEQTHKWRPHMKLTSPMRDGSVSDWDALEQVWRYACSDVLKANPEEHPLMFCEPSWNARLSREKLVELAFESFNTPAFYLGRSAVLSAFAAGKSSALVVESGASSTNIVPVLDGYVLKKGIVRAPIGGDFVSSQIRLLFQSIGIDPVPHYLVKSKMPVDSTMPSNHVLHDRPNTTPSFQDYATERVIQEFKETVVQVASSAYDERIIKKKPPKNFEFSTGFNRPFTIERFRCAEGLFQQSFIIPPLNPSDPTQPLQNQQQALPPTIPQLIHSSLLECDLDIRPLMIGNVVLSGANTLLPGFADRLYAELHQAAPGMNIKVAAAGGGAERRFGPWIGGSILASLGSFHQLWISKQQYEEMGASVEKRIH